jgi:AhpD family alkylhydroperoxidase
LWKAGADQAGLNILQHIKRTLRENSGMSGRVEEFNEYRSRMNARILEIENRPIKRFFGVDTLTYDAGALDVRTKEMLGLVASMVLRCDDCIAYHVQRCKEEKVNDAELYDVFSVALVVGGSIVIPHLRRAVEFLDEWNALQKL